MFGKILMCEKGGIEIMAKKEDRAYLGLKCTECGYNRRPTIKNKKNTTDKMELKKYCPNCKKQTAFKETKLAK